MAYDQALYHSRDPYYADFIEYIRPGLPLIRKLREINNELLPEMSIKTDLFFRRSKLRDVPVDEDQKRTMGVLEELIKENSEDIAWIQARKNGVKAELQGLFGEFTKKIVRVNADLSKLYLLFSAALKEARTKNMLMSLYFGQQITGENGLYFLNGHALHMENPDLMDVSDHEDYSSDEEEPPYLPWIPGPRYNDNGDRVDEHGSPVDQDGNVLGVAMDVGA